MIEIKVKYFAGLRTVKGKKEEIMTIDEKITITDLLEKLEIKGKTGTTILVNGRRQSESYSFNRNDEISIFPMIGGG